MNDNPIAVDDTATVAEGGTLNVAAPGVLANDSDAEGDPLTVNTTPAIAPANGALTLYGDGAYDYTHDGSETTSDSFVYEISDGNGGTDTATVNLTITPVNDNPIAVDDTATVAEGGTLNVAAPGVLANDSDAEGDPLTVNTTPVDAPDNGTLTLYANGAYDYTHDGSETTSDSFAYEISDGNGGTDTATVDLAITPVNDNPIAVDDTATVAQGGTHNVTAPGVLANDSDAEGDPLTVNTTPVVDPTNGTLTLYADGAYDYTHDGSVTISDSFVYEVSDGNGGTDTATVAVTVEASGPKLSIGVVQGVDNTTWTTVTLNRSYNSMVVVCSLNYDSAQPPLVVRVRNATSGDTFEVRVQRADGSTTPISGVPVHYMAVEAGTYTLAEHGVSMEAVKFTSTITDNDSSWIAEVRSYNNAYTSPVVFGQVMTENDAGFSVFWSRGSSRKNPPSNSTLRVGKTVCEDPDRTRADETIGYLVVETGSGTLEGIPYVAALGGDLIRGMSNAPPYTYSLSGLSNVSLAIATQAGMDGFHGGWAVLYGLTPVTATSLQLAIDEDQLKDSERSHQTEQVSYLIFDNFNEPPLANDDAYSGDEDVILNIAAPGVLDNDSDPTGDALTAVLVSDPSDGNVSLNGDGSFSYAPNAEFFGTDSFTYQANDGIANSNVATVSLTVNPVNDAPVADDQSVITDEDTAVAITLTASDIDGDPLTYNVVAGPADGTLSGTAPDLIYTPDPGFSGADQFTFQANDGVVDSNVATVSITVNAAPQGSPPFLQSGLVTASTDVWTIVPLGHDYGSNMVVVCTPTYNSAVASLVVGVRNAAGSSFEVRLQRTAGLGTITTQVHFAAVEVGVYNVVEYGVKMEAAKFISTITDRKGSWNGENQSYNNAYTQPVVLGQVMTSNDPSWSAFWCRSDSSRKNPPDSTLRVGKHVGENPNTIRADETLGYIVIEAGSGLINGIAYTTDLGADTIRGVDDFPPYTYSLGGLASASVVVATQAAMDGRNGGWAILYGPGPLSTSALNLAIDEDQAADSERSHTSEQVSFIVFE